jgi:hypothetical protein
MTEQTLVPNRLLFHFELPVRYRESPTIDGKLDDWSDQYVLPYLGQLENKQPFARIYMGWNETGLFVAAHVQGRRSAFNCDPRRFWKSDNLRICTDMRDTRNIKRASRYCQQFYFLPAGGGKDGRSAVADAAPIHRAAEPAPPVPEDSIQAASIRSGDTYTIEGHIPAEALAGFDPDEHKRIGLYYIIEDSDLGQQYLTVGDELNWHIDPSTWATAVLTR